ncbi:MAG: 50S ribosomal protein L5 [Candidatus Portnoybacteria bacterium]|nr:50S ribosomal protein L5 [Candidatus Portnoybacteria bacterium]
MKSLQEKYKKEVIPAMKEKFGYGNILAVPHFEKVTVNIGIGKFSGDEKALEEIIRDLTMIVGQKPVFTKAKKAIAAFKTRQGMKVGLVATLRKQKMFDFLERLVSLASPRSRDFRGLNQKSVDQNGNLTIGLKEHIIFPEISHENIHHIFGLEITVKTTAKTQEEGMELFRMTGFPIKTN